MKTLIFVPFFLYACGSDTPAFVEKPEGIITLSVAHDDASDPTGDGETVFSNDINDEDEASSADAEAMAEAEAGTDTSVSDSKSDSKVFSESGGTPDRSGSEAADDNTSIAKACGPYLRNFASKLKIVDGDRSNTQLSLAPDTALAIKLTGDQSRLVLNLPAGNDIPGICFFITGHKAQLTFSSASEVRSFVYRGRGDQSSGAVSFLGGSPVEAHVDLKGNHPTLRIQGLDPDLCVQERLVCNP